MATKYTNWLKNKIKIFQSEAFQNRPKFGGGYENIPTGEPNLQRCVYPEYDFHDR
jgi:hypothetical protein